MLKVKNTNMQELYNVAVSIANNFVIDVYCRCLQIILPNFI